MSRRALAARIAALVLAVAAAVAMGVMWLATDPNADTAECVVRSAGVPTPGLAPAEPCPEGAR